MLPNAYLQQYSKSMVEKYNTFETLFLWEMVGGWRLRDLLQLRSHPVTDHSSMDLAVSNTDW